MRKSVCLCVLGLTCWLQPLTAHFAHYFSHKKSYAGRFDLKGIVQAYQENEQEILGRYLKEWSVSVIDRMPNVFIAEPSGGEALSYVEVSFETLHNGTGMVTFTSHDRKSNQVTGEAMLLFEESQAMLFYPPAVAMQRNVYYAKVLQGAIAAYLQQQRTQPNQKTPKKGELPVSHP